MSEAKGQVAGPSQLSAMLNSVGIDKLNSLQRAALPPALRREDVLVHAETGAGKTLCFAIPLVGALAGVDWRPGAAPLCSIVLSPTLELCAQTARILNQLCEGCAIVASSAEAGIDKVVGVAPILVAPASLALKLLTLPDESAQETTYKASEWEEDDDDFDGVAAAAGRLRLHPSVSAPTLRAIVLDEADALVAPLAKYATHRQKETRKGNPKPASVLIRLLCVREALELQVLAASATVGRPLRRELAQLCGRTLPLVQVPSGSANGDAAAAAAEAEAAMAAMAASGRNGASKGTPTTNRAVSLPASLELEVLAVEEDNVLAAVHQVLTASSAEQALLFVAAGRRVPPEVRLFRQCGLHSAVSLSDHLLGVAYESDGDDDEAATRRAQTPQLLVASPSVARGLDLPNVGLVIVLGLPTTADQLIHLAGRTARQGASGRAVFIATPSECDARIGTLSAQLGVDLRSCCHEVSSRNEEWAGMWAVHQKVIQAEAKYKNTPSAEPTRKSKRKPKRAPRRSR